MLSAHPSCVVVTVSHGGDPPELTSLFGKVRQLSGRVEAHEVETQEAPPNGLRVSKSHTSSQGSSCFPCPARPRTIARFGSGNTARGLVACTPEREGNFLARDATRNSHPHPLLLCRKPPNRAAKGQEGVKGQTAAALVCLIRQHQRWLPRSSRLESSGFCDWPEAQHFWPIDGRFSFVSPQAAPFMLDSAPCVGRGSNIIFSSCLLVLCSLLLAGMLLG